MKLDLALEEFLYTRNNTVSIKGFILIIITIKALEGP